jgi:hypothetical protein
MTMHLPPRNRDTCGTYLGWHQHQHRNEQACFRCSEARRFYDEDRRQAPKRRAVLAEAVGGGSYGGRSS